MTVFELIKLSLFTNDMIVYMEDPKDTTRNFLKLINIFSKVAGYNTNIKKISSPPMYQWQTYWEGNHRNNHIHIA